MNNETNKIEGIGLIRNHLAHDKRHKIYNNNEYNRYIYRGKYWLDGIMRTNSKGHEITDKIIQMIKTSNHYHQIRVILINRELLNTNLDIKKLSLETEKPVMALGCKKTMQDGLCSCEWRKTPVSFIGLNEKIAQKVLNMSCKNDEPEALRIARLIVESFKQN
jgi:endonuclease V-like protein UPF0215 family